ncbi:FAD-dependent oxidoreductase [Demequina sp. SO4-13]|uniref:FAD-dependent oxidoreductase n=1 Tax=Demequina sp. SO4-13 TaxID=3401027 RepID=UPI003AF424B1
MTPPLPWDAIVIGGGAAGLSAAQMLGRSRRRTLVIDAGRPRNRFATHMHGILGHDGLDPADLLAKGRVEVERYGVEVRTGSVETVKDEGDTIAVTLDGTATMDSTVEHTRAIVFATGITDVLPDVPGLAERWGTTVAHCPYCHGWEVRDRRIGVLVAHAGQVHLAYMVRQLSDSVMVFAQDPGLVDQSERERLAARGVQVIDSAVTGLHGTAAGSRVATAPDLTHVTTADGATHQVDAIFTAGVPHPHDHALNPLGLKRTDGPGTSVIATELDGATSHPRVWAAGNVVNPMESVPMAASAGAVAGARVNAFLVTEDFDIALGSPDMDPSAFWEGRYADSERSWSGSVNPTLASAVADLPPGSVLDLGCGEGADVIWFARQGWDARGLDISPTAIARARAAAADAGAEASFEVTDLAGWQPAQAYDLVTASFFHSPVELPRTEVLTRASAAVKPGGHLLLVTHVAPPPWAEPEWTRHHTFLSARQEADALGLDADEWDEVRVEEVEREVTDPDGRPATLADGVVLMRRR